MSSVGLNFTTDNNSLTVPNTGQVLAASDLLAGFGDSNLLVEAAQPYSLDINLALTLPAQTGANIYSDMVRISVVQDLQANGSAPTISDLFEIAGSSPLVDHYNFDNDRRFNWLYDDWIEINAYGSLGMYTVPTNRVWRRSVDLSEAERITYQPGVADAKTGSIWIVMSSYNGVVVAECVSRLWYKFL